ncbi:MAG: glycosyltransferase family 9 protein [Gemmatimonadota bacterium]
MPGTLVVRAPNHLGDLVLALPALQRARPDAIVVRRPLLPLLEMARLPGQLIPLDRGLVPLIQIAARLRTARYARGVLLTPSLSSAVLFRLAGMPARRGTATDGRSPLLTDRVEPASLANEHRASAYLVLVGDTLPAVPPVPELSPDAHARERWHALIGEARGLIGIFPGSNASSRRWEPGHFGELTHRLADAGKRTVIFGGPGERHLTAAAAGSHGIDLGGKTDLAVLAAGLAECRMLVTNDSGPMHLAAAVGTPTISLWGAGNPAETGPLGAGHRVLRHAELPCVPCRANTCPRSGRGTVLPRAERECLELITVDEVMTAIAQQPEIGQPFRLPRSAKP